MKKPSLESFSFVTFLVLGSYISLIMRSHLLAVCTVEQSPIKVESASETKSLRSESTSSVPVGNHCLKTAVPGATPLSEPAPKCITLIL